jgi:hypothetical protein
MIENNVMKLKCVFLIKIYVPEANVRQIIEVQIRVNLFLELIKHESISTCETIGIESHILHLDTR